MARESALFYIWKGSELVGLEIHCENATDPQPTGGELELVRIFNEHKRMKGELKRQSIWLEMYEQDANDLIEEYGCDPDDKLDREDLKRMLNSLIGKNRRLKERCKDCEPLRGTPC